MKKIVLFIIVLMLCACSQPEIVKEDFTYLLFATPLKEHTIWLKAKNGFDEACRENEIKCDWLGPTVIDTDEMQSVIDTAILQKADGIITQGVIDAKLIDKAYAAGIPIILVDSDIPESKRFAYIGKDFHQQARLLLEDIEEKYGEKKPLKIAVQVAEKSFKIATDQINEIEKVFATHEGGFEIVSISESKSDQVRSKKEWESVLQTNPDINVAINFAAESAELIAELSEEKGLKKNMLIYGVDDMQTTLELIKNGKIDGTVVTSFYDYGYKSVGMLLDYIRKHEGLKNTILAPELLIVNKDNVENYEK